jgi:hypothetical protein
MKNFSFIINSRGRPKMLANYLESIAKTTDNLDKIDAWIGIDNDDLDSLIFAGEYDKNPLFETHFIISDRPKSLNANFNKLAKQAQGTFQVNGNDDCEYDINTCNHWDTIVLKRIKEFKEQNNIKDNIIYAAVADSSIDKPNGSLYASFPIISKEAVEVLGFHMDENFFGLGADNALHKIYSAIGRAIYIPEIKIRHLMHEDLIQIITADQTAHEMRRNTLNSTTTLESYNYQVHINKLKNYIKNYDNQIKN